MYILKNSVISIVRNKGRNILIGIIILVISAASTVTLAIRNTAKNIVEDYEEANDIIASISFNRNQLTENFKGGEDAEKENIEAFNNIEQITLDDVKNYGDSSYLKGYYYVYATSLDSDTLSKATDTFEYEVEDTQTSTTTSSYSTGSQSDMPDGMQQGEGMHTHTDTNTTTVITRSMETFESNRNLTGDFEIDGYSSYDAMTDFVSGDYTIEEGTMISDFSGFECVINSELATLNEISVGDTITFKNSNTSVTYDFTVVGIYKDSSDTGDTKNMYSQSSNTIITGSGVVESLVQEDSSLTTSITPSFIVLNEESIDSFTEELKNKGLSDYYSVETNLEELKNATKSISNVETFATTFLLITLGISAVILFTINMINIRERKYEIGVFRTIGMSKFKLTIQFLLELLIVTIIMLFIGAGIGASLSKQVGNYLLTSEISDMEDSNQEISNNFGKDFGGGDMPMEFSGTVNANVIDSIDAVVDYTVVLQLLGIGIALTLISSLASLISIQRFSPLTILKERS